jgi:hypothetical protein
MANELISTALLDDPDPEGCDVYGVLPLVSEIVDDDEEDEEDAADREDRGHRPSAMGAKGRGDDEGDEEPPLIDPTYLEIDVPPGTELPDDDDDAFLELTAHGVTDVSPGEAKRLIDYMRPLSEDEQEIADDPYLNDVRWIDDPAHAADVLKAGKGEDGVDQYMDDATYGEDRALFPTAAHRRSPPAQKIRSSALAPERDLAKLSVVRGLGRKLVVEHANWLADQDLSSGIAVRPRSYYEDVARLWTRDELKKAKVPTSTTSGWTAPTSTFVGKADAVLVATSSRRSRFSRALGADVDVGGWSPWSAVKSAVKKTAGLAYKGIKYTALKPLEYGYKYGVKKPFSYTYKGVKYVGKLAQKLALAPIRAIVKHHTGTIANRRASFLAKQQGLSTPTPAMQAQAKDWTKKFVAQNNPKYGSAIASLMGEDDTRVREVDVSLGDEMGLGTAGVAGLILLGPIGLIAVLTGLVKLSSSQAPPPDPGSDAAASEAAAAAQAAQEAEEAQAAQDAGTPPDAGAPPDAAPTPDEGSYSAEAADASGLGLPSPRYVSVEQLQGMHPREREVAKRLVRAGRLRLT